MPDVLIASSEADSRAAAAVVEHHAELAGGLAARTEALLVAAGRPDRAGSRSAADELVAWAERELVPHALAEEQALYPAAQATTEGRLLVDGMLAEHRAITALVHEVAAATEPVRAAAAARALAVLFDAHLAKENEQVLPLLAGRKDVSLADLLEGMHALLGGHQEPTVGSRSGPGEHACACGEHDAAGYPELDARSIPHAIRHATVFGALDSVGPGGGLVLVAPHDPLPLLDQVARRFPGRFTTDYLDRGPQTWRILFTRVG
jgi:uncharacterized protein (DUF2249 family)